LAAAALDQLPTEENAVPELNSEVVLYAARRALDQHTARKDFVLLRVEAGTFWVLLNLMPSQKIASVIPKFWRTRVIRIEVRHGKYFLICSCALPNRKGLVCRHIYCLLNRLPDSADLIPRWHKSYARYFFEDEKLTEL